ncbi:FixH family protein [Exiguobacterium sp. S90]|uniref:FixH family protein n=1 Tax=Exiguobacterium sp. S90 TaxID=1221231 RepID=UPI001BE654BD|nr:FixH family protein [Exiguobacterium sp. S90]
MKKMMGMSVAVLATGLFLAGCNNSEEKAMDHDAMQGSGKPAVDVTVEVPAKTMADEKVIFKATAVEDKKAVNVEDVTFEIWKADEKDTAHKKIKASLKKTGSYQAEATLAEGEYEGLYHINDKKGLHHMDKISFTVMDHSHEEASHDDADHDHASSENLAVHYMGATKVTAGATLPVSFHIFEKGEVLKADVQVEVIEEGVEKHTYIPLTLKDDMYVGQVKLAQAGQTTVRLHVENDQLHHHQDQLITVTP